MALNLVAGDQLQKDSRNWLSPPDPSENYNIASEIHQDGTATWFFKGSVFAEWNAKGSLLWINGKRMFLSDISIATILIPLALCSGLRKKYSDVCPVSLYSIEFIHGLCQVVNHSRS